MICRIAIPAGLPAALGCHDLRSGIGGRCGLSPSELRVVSRGKLRRTRSRGDEVLLSGPKQERDKRPRNSSTPNHHLSWSRLSYRLFDAERLENSALNYNQHSRCGRWKEKKEKL